MSSHPTDRRRIIELIFTIIVISLCILAIVISSVLKLRRDSRPNLTDTPDDNLSTTEPTTPPSEDSNPPEDSSSSSDEDYRENIPDFINLQPIVDQWLAALDNAEKVGLMIYDLDNYRIAAEYHADEVFDVASLYKLLFVYDGYLQIARGFANADDYYTRTATKGNLTLSACLDLMIRESYNGCADKMFADSTRRARVQELISTLDLSHTYDYGLRSSASDLTKVLQTYWLHEELTPDLWAQIADSMLNQPPALGGGDKIYDWRQGLPAGFSNNADVYNKVGWEWGDNKWNTYADAAIVDFPDFNRTYTMVVITSNLSTEQKITRLGTILEEFITLHSLRLN